MRNRPVRLRRPMPAQSIQEILTYLLAILAAVEALYQLIQSIINAVG